MSKMSMLHAELSEQCAELGFEDLGEAEQAGYGVDWQNARLIPPIEMAHKEWEKERAGVLADLRELRNDFVAEACQDEIDAIDRAISFIEKGAI